MHVPCQRKIKRWNGFLATNALRQVTTLSWNSSNCAQQLRTAMSLASPLSTRNFSYGYDSAWRVTNVVSPAGMFGYHYLSSIFNLPSSISLPNYATITNTYDPLARLKQTSFNNFWGHTLDGYTYTLDPLGLRTNIVRNLGLTNSSVAIGYDSIGQLTSWNAAEGSGTLRQNEQLGFSFDAADNLHSRTNGAMLQTFTVDAANELTNVTRTGTFTLSGAIPAPMTSATVNGQSAQTYGDFTFARTNLSLTNGQNTFTIVGQNVYGTDTTNILTVNLPQSVTLAFDNNGNLTNDGTRGFGYNTENQLTNVSVSGQWQVSFVYDGLGRRRIARDYSWSGGTWMPTNEVHYIYDGYLPVQERDANNNVLVTYTRGLDLSGDFSDAGGIGGLLGRTDTNGSTFYHADGAGNITALMDTQQNIAARYLYNPFGKPLGQWGPIADVNEMQSSSMPRDNLSGLSFYPFRDYEPNLQRWLNQDPIAEWGGINLYRAMNNNPLRYLDPLGLLEGEGNPVSGLGARWNVNPNSPGGSFYGPGYQYRPFNWSAYEAQVAAQEAQNAALNKQWIDENYRTIGGMFEYGDEFFNSEFGQMMMEYGPYGMGMPEGELGNLGKLKPCPTKFPTLGWSGSKRYIDALNKIRQGGPKVNLGFIPTKDQALQMLQDAGVDVNSGSREFRIQDAHDSPPHNYPHINYPTPSGGKGTIQIQ